MKEDILEQIKNVEGLLNDEEAKILFSLAKNVKDKGFIVEIGSWKGKSTICLAKGAKKDVKVFAIDPHDVTFSVEGKELPSWTRQSYKNKLLLKGAKESSSLKDFRKNIRVAKVNKRIREIVQISEEASKKVNEPIELIFIDGDHSYESVKKDFYLWYPKVINNGIMAFHDTLWGGPRKLVVDALYKSNNFRNIKFVNSLTYGQKVEKNTFWERLDNRKNLFISYIYCLIYDISFHLARNLPKNIKANLKKIFLSLH